MQTTIQIMQGKLQSHGASAGDIALAILIVLVAAATVVDIREHRIPNKIVLAGVLLGCGFHMLAPSGQGPAFTLAGLAVGMTALFPFYAMGAMGAGDVKLMGMVGAFLGTSAVIGAVLATMIAGGILALLASAHKRMLPQLIANLRTMIVERHIRALGGAVAGDSHPPASVGKLPYAVAIATGTACEIFWLRA
jgi:prepilin peptidase CpaA